MDEEKYTWDDIIIDPTSERAKEAVGKEVYMSDTPSYCLLNANENNSEYFAILRDIREDQTYPFCVKRHNINYEEVWPCVIVKKEEPKSKRRSKYIPYQITTRNLAEYWEKLKGRAFIVDDEECTLIETVTTIYKNFDAEEADINKYSVSMLCDEARWLDTGEPVGEEIEDE